MIRLEFKCAKPTDHLKIDVAGNTSLDREAAGEVPTTKVQSGANDEVWDFGDSLGTNKGNPVVCFGLEDCQRPSIVAESGFPLYLLLTGFKQVSVVEEKWLHLVDASGCHKDEVEDRKKPQL